MPKPELDEPLATLERNLIETMLAGLKRWRPDLDYPESYSDMQGCVRAAFRLYEIRRRDDCDVCDECDGSGFYYINRERQKCICSEPQI